MARRDRSELIRIAAGELFATQGVSATTVRQIGEKIGMVSGTLYYYFPSKESIASDILNRFLDELNAEYTDLPLPTSLTAKEQLLSLVRTSFAIALRHPYATEIYQNEASSLSILPDHETILAKRNRAQATWQTIIAHGVAQQELRVDIDSDDFRRMLSELTWLNVRWHRDSLAKDHERLAHELTSIFLDGFTSRVMMEREI